jgi:hypothetical protein
MRVWHRFYSRRSSSHPILSSCLHVVNMMLTQCLLLSNKESGNEGVQSVLVFRPRTSGSRSPNGSLEFYRLSEDRN